jgi:ABC-2 type transport system ATP-binding protein
VSLLDVGLRRPTLDDVFLALTGQPTDATSPEGTDAPTEEVDR